MSIFSGHDFGPARAWNQNGSGSRLNIVYFALAFVNLLTVAAAMYVGYQVLEIIRERAEESVEWDQKLQIVHEFSASAGAIFQPANEVFSSKDPDQSAKQLSTAAEVFERKNDVLQTELKGFLADEEYREVREELHARMGAIVRFVRQARILGNAAIAAFKDGDQERAGELMVKSDRLADQVQEATLAISELMTKDLINDLEQAGIEADGYRKGLAVFGGLMILFVIGTIVYGLNLSRVLGALARRQQQQLQEIAARETQLAEKNKELAAANDIVGALVQRAQDGIEAISEGYALFDAEYNLIQWNTKIEQIFPMYSGKIRVGTPALDMLMLLVDHAMPGDSAAEDGWIDWRAKVHETMGVPFEQIVNGRMLQLIENRTNEGGIVIIHRDITDARAQQEELTRAKLIAENANEAKTQFLANMNHEIRTPLNGVIGMTEILLEGDLNPEQRLQIEIARNSADQLLQVIGDILDVSKLEAGALELEQTPFDLLPLVESTVQNFAAKAHAKGLEICVDIDGAAEGWYLGDPTRLKQILLNFIGNSIKFTDTGSVVVSVRGGELGTDRAVLSFAVRDTGIGMNSDALGRLFQKFTQADNSITRRFGGTGLGLSISKQLIEAMGGSVAVKSQSGEGSEFSFAITLPTSVGAAAVKPSGLVGKRILVVDDHELNRAIQADRLGRWGIVVDTVDCATAALEALAVPGTRYDAALIDRKMPDMDGLALAEHIRRIYGDKAPKLVLWSSLSHTANAIAAEATKLFDASVFKPVQSNTMFTTLQALLTETDVNTTAKAGLKTSNPLLGQRVLLVEDNETNRYAAMTMLKQLGCTVSVAENGLVAVEKAMTDKFDLILMDLQMPEMDGIAATTLIRGALGPNQHVPILALTANAFVEDGERCRAAGMNDHLTKPLRKSILETALKAHCRREPVLQPVPVPVQHMEQMASAIDLSNEAWTALVEDFGTDGVRRLVDTFVFQQQAELQSLSADDRADLHRKAHSLKGSAKLFGAIYLSDLASTLEDQALTAETSDLSNQIAAVMSAFADTCQAIRLKLVA